jgi:hypothetical protein
MLLLLALRIFQPMVLLLSVAGMPICSGAIIDREGPTVLTAAHCLRNEPYIEVGGLPGTVLVRWATPDIAIVRPVLQGRVAEALKLGPMPEPDAEVFAIGYPMGSGPVMLRGRMLTCGAMRCLFDMGAAQGLSGAPILDRKGRLVSMLIGYQGLLTVGVSPDLIRTAVKVSQGLAQHP